ncbi:LytR/AlgR family response regulator transcription factor [Chitinophaga nivalis]|uniref:LytTR family DNA-binding domain-containing protein n=1 Tax=Chitinophaga nivalis TaxID=2991709 RepID=A0ABT3IJH1_9BACT|nr:LytTR family DNA-binding domain-containing protein [Chitinophaga nivalis]MCW3466206.1 LytTR family DNA-binding domain-containing protein [Chitinophaga nivalis]MCW3484103.1 LytTR family DNA-binding domain-containing protein [Chitinophaga nivalis]
MEIKCIIVDDEALAREGLKKYIKTFDFLSLTASCNNAITAREVLEETPVDLLFLDINMPKMSGLHLLETLSDPPVTILVTAYPDYALEGFRLDVMDYLLKPISLQRFTKAVQKAQDYFMLRQQQQQQLPASNPVVADYIFVKHKQVYEKVMLADILFVESMQNYVIIQTIHTKIIAYLTFKSVEQQLPADTFLRIHKSYIVNLQHISTVDSNMVQVAGRTLPVSRSQRELLMQVVNKRLLTK